MYSDKMLQILFTDHSIQLLPYFKLLRYLRK